MSLKQQQCQVAEVGAIPLVISAVRAKVDPYLAMICLDKKKKINFVVFSYSV